MVNIVKIKNISIGDGKFVLFGGPCMAETLETCLKTAEFLKKVCQDLDIQYVFKASYDKANRSGFGTKRGPGIENGLKMLAEVKNRFDVPIVTDIHNPEEAAKAAEEECEIDWLFKKNLNYYENLSRPLSDDSIYDGTLFDVLPSLNVRVGGQEKVEEELVPAQPQPTKQSMKQPTKQLNHDAANHQNHPKHHSEDEKKTKIWPIILWIIAILLWLFF